MAETWLVVRVGNFNCNSNTTFLFSVWSHPRIPLRIWTSQAGEKKQHPENGMCSLHHDRSASNVVMQSKCATDVRFLPRTATLCTISTTLLARFPQYQERSILRELFEVVCNTHFCLSSLSFSHLTLLQDSLYRRFLIMRHISNVAS